MGLHGYGVIEKKQKMKVFLDVCERKEDCLGWTTIFGGWLFIFMGGWKTSWLVEGCFR